MSPKKGSTRRVMSRVETVTAVRLLDSHLTKVAEGLYRYKGDWTDAAIASEISSTLNASHISHLRSEAYGDLVKPEPNAPLAEQVALLARRIDRIDAWLVQSGLLVGSELAEIIPAPETES